MNQVKNGLALALVTFLTVVVGFGVAWAVTLVDFDYSTSYTTTGHFPFNHTAGSALPANTDLGATDVGKWSDRSARNAFNPNALSVRTGVIHQSSLLKFAANPETFTKSGAGTLNFSVANNVTVRPALATTVTAGKLGVYHNGSIGTGQITVAGGATFVAAGTMTKLPPLTTMAGGKFTVETTSLLTGTTITNNGILDVETSGLIDAAIINNGTIEVKPNRELTVTASSTGAGTASIGGKFMIKTTTPITNSWKFSGIGTLVVDTAANGSVSFTGDSSLFTGGINVHNGTVVLSGAKVGTALVPAQKLEIAADKTVILKNGTQMHIASASLNTGSVLGFDLTGAAPKLVMNTLHADSSSVIDITLNEAPQSGYLDFTVNDTALISPKPRLRISTGFRAEWVGNRIKITVDQSDPIAPNVSPTSAIFDRSNPMNLPFVLGSDALVAAKNGTLSLYVDGTKLEATSYQISNSSNLTLFSAFLKTLPNGAYTIALKNSTGNTGTIRLIVTTSANVSPTTAIFDRSNPTNLTFVLGGEALVAAKSGTLSIYADSVQLEAASYSISDNKLTIFSTFLATLFNGTPAITLHSGTANVGTISLGVTASSNVSPIIATFDRGKSPSPNLEFVLGGDALTASKNGTLSIYTDTSKVNASHYSADGSKLTIFSAYLKMLGVGRHTIGLMNGTKNEAIITLTVVDSGGTVDNSSSSGCNAGAALPVALMLLAPLALFYKKD